MPNYHDYALVQLEDGSLTIPLAPPAPISGWTLRFLLTQNFGGLSGLITGYAASGFNNVSGINVTDGANGILKVPQIGARLSGYDPGVYCFTVSRLDSGFRTDLLLGNFLYTPGAGY